MTAFFVRRVQAGALVLVAFALALTLKRFYSEASAEALRFVLAPTTWLTAVVLGARFEFVPGAGYLSRELSVLIAPACAGMNFVIVAFLTLALGFGARFDGVRRQMGWMLGALALAFVVTVLVNATRIVVSVRIAHAATSWLGSSFQAVHRLIGIGVYLIGLFVLCAAVDCALSRERGRGLLRPTWVALPCYAGVTVLVPLLRGAARNPGWTGHALAVSVAVTVCAALALVVRFRPALLRGQRAHECVPRTWCAVRESAPPSRSR